MQGACFLIMLRGEHTLVFHIGISLVLLAKVGVLKFLNTGRRLHQLSNVSLVNNSAFFLDFSGEVGHFFDSKIPSLIPRNW